MRERVGIQTVEVIEQELAAANVLQAYLLQRRMNGEFPDLMYQIVRRSQRLAKLQTSLLAVTLVRFSDLKNIDLISLLSGEAQVIQQQKTGANTVVQLDKVDLLTSPGQDFHRATTTRLSYNALAWNLRHSLRHEQKLQVPDSKDVCHIFRHLFATWRYRQGDSYEEIGKRLGHTSQKAVIDYIHEDLPL